jgi:hypothetical protein
MPLPPRPLSRRVSRLLNRFLEICWLVPLDVAEDERIIRAIYSPYHVDKHNRLKHQAYDPTPGTDEISTMRLEHMGAPFCRVKAKSIENPKKVLAGLAVLKVATVVSKGMQVVDSRQQYCGHADIRLLIAEIANRQKGEPLSPVVGKHFRDLKEQLLKSSTFFSDPNPNERNRANRNFLERVENHS